MFPIQDPQHPIRQFGLVLFTIFVDLVGFGIILPILPFYLTALGGNAIQLGALVAVYSLMQILFGPLWGNFSDNIGRRPVILIGLMGSAISFAMFAFAQSIPQLFIARSLAGLFTAATLPTARTYIADLALPKVRSQSFALIGVAYSLGLTFGPVIGSIFSSIPLMNFPSETFPSLVAALLSFVNFLGVLFWVPESLTKELREFKATLPRYSLVSSIKLAFTLPNVGLLMTTFLGINIVFFGFETIFPLYSHERDSSIAEVEVGYMFGVIGLTMILTQSIFMKRVSKYLTGAGIIRFGMVFIAIGLIILIFSRSYLVILVSAIGIAGGLAITSPALNAEIAGRVPLVRQGQVLNGLSGLNAFTRVVAPLIAGAFYEMNITLYLVFGTLFLLIVIYLSLTRFKDPTFMEEFMKSNNPISKLLKKNGIS